MKHLVERGKLPSLGPKIRQPQDRFAWFSTVKNKAIATRPDYGSKLVAWLAIIGFVILFGASAIDAEAQPILFYGLQLRFSGPPPSWESSLAGGPSRYRDSGKSDREPRTLLLYDSWQAVLFGAAGSTALLRERFDTILREAPIRGLKSAVERIQYRALDMVEERDQIVLTAGRGVIYCQIYEFGTDLYIGWQSFLNRGKWVESSVCRWSGSRDRQDCRSENRRAGSSGTVGI